MELEYECRVISGSCDRGEADLCGEDSIQIHLNELTCAWILSICIVRKRGIFDMCIMCDNETIKVLFAYHIVKIYACVEIY